MPVNNLVISTSNYFIFIKILINFVFYFNYKLKKIASILLSSGIVLRTLVIKYFFPECLVVVFIIKKSLTIYRMTVETLHFFNNL